MSRPMSQIEIEEALVECQARLEDLLEAYRVALIEVAEAESRFKSAHAGAYLRRSGPVKERDAYADHVTESEMQAFNICEAVVKYTKSAMDVRFREQDMLRTLNANLRPMVSQS